MAKHLTANRKKRLKFVSGPLQPSEGQGIAHIKSGFNDATITVTKPNGDVVFTVSTRERGFKSRHSKKGVSSIFRERMKKLAEAARGNGIRRLETQIDGSRPATERALFYLKQTGLLNDAPQQPQLPRNPMRVPLQEQSFLGTIYAFQSSDAVVDVVGVGGTQRRMIDAGLLRASGVSMEGQSFSLVVIGYGEPGGEPNQWETKILPITRAADFRPYNPRPQQDYEKFKRLGRFDQPVAHATAIPANA